MNPGLTQALTFPGFGGSGRKTYAAWPVWKDSTTKDVRYKPLPKKKAVRLYHEARRFERQTRRPGKQDGALGRNGLAVLHAMLFDCLNYASGRLDPSYEGLARLACISYRSAARGLQKLRAAGVLNWVRRCTPTLQDGRFVLEQETNAYAVLPATQWRGYAMPAPVAGPMPGTWGDHPPLPDLLTQAAQERQEGAGIRRTIELLSADPRDGLAMSLARLAASIHGRKTQ